MRIKKYLWYIAWMAAMAVIIAMMFRAADKFIQSTQIQLNTKDSR